MFRIRCQDLSQNVDAIIGHEEPVIYPEHLTQELDCEIQLAVVLKKSGKNFSLRKMPPNTLAVTSSSTTLRPATFSAAK